MTEKSCSNCANMNCIGRGRCIRCSNWRELESAQKPHSKPNVFTPTELLEALAEQHNARLILSPRCSGKKFLLSLGYWLSQVEKMENDAAEVDRLARFRSRVCQFLGVGGEADDEAILEVLKTTVDGSWKPAKMNSGSAGSSQKAIEQKGLQFAMDEINKLLCKPEPSRWISCEDELPYFRTRVLVTAVRNREHYTKDTEPERQFIAMRMEELTPGKWYWANAAEMYSHEGIGGMLALAGWEIIAWQPLPEEYRKEP